MYSITKHLTQVLFFLCSIILCSFIKSLSLKFNTTELFYPDFLLIFYLSLKENIINKDTIFTLILILALDGLNNTNLCTISIATVLINLLIRKYTNFKKKDIINFPLLSYYFIFFILIITKLIDMVVIETNFSYNSFQSMLTLKTFIMFFFNSLILHFIFRIFILLENKLNPHH